MMEDDGPSYGGGSSKGGGGSKGGGKKTSAAGSKSSTLRLTETDPDYPKDIPSGSEHYEIFWRKELREVIDQGIRRLCWTIASTRSLSSQLLLQKKVDSLMYFSVIHLLIGLYDKTDKSGGLRNLSHLKKFLEESGAVLEEDCECIDPIAQMKNNEKGESKIPPPVLCTHKRKPKKVFRVKELIVLAKVNEEELIRLVNKGPVAISVVLHPEFEKFRGDGIYKGVDQSEPPSDYHMLLCSGYGTLDGVHYWDVQNSAGRKWGNNGFGKIIRKSSRGGKPSLIHAIIYPVLLEDYA